MNQRQLDIELLEGGFRPGPVPPGFDLERLPPSQSLPLVETLESRTGPWQVGGTYGRIENLEFPRTLDADPAPIFSIDGQIGPPRPRTLNLFRSDAQVSLGGNADWYASVTYGVGGVSNNFLCDWLRGGQISLVCQTLRVDAIAYRPIGNVAYSPPAGVQLLGAMLSHTGSAPPRPPTFTTQRTTVPTGDFVDFAVPDFARWVYPGSGSAPPDLDSAPTNLFISFFNLGGFALKTAQFTASTQLDGLQIPGGSTQVRISNSTGIDRQFLLSFQLGI